MSDPHHFHAHGRDAAATRQAGTTSTLGMDAGTRLLRLAAALAVLWLAVAWVMLA